jgi:hypothetical protein
MIDALNIIYTSQKLEGANRCCLKIRSVRLIDFCKM